MGNLTKNTSIGGEITDLNELVRLSKEKKAVAIKMTNLDHYLYTKPASFVINWPLRVILKTRLYYVVKDSDIPEVEFEEQ